MKKIFKFTCITFISLLLIGCEETLYEDKEMTKSFVESHRKELNIVEEFDNTKTFQPYYTMFITQKSGEIIKTNMANCSHTIFFRKSLFGSYSLLFEKKDIIKNGKNVMFQNTEQCLLEAVHFKVQNDQVQKNRLKIQEEENKQLNQKFVLQSK